ncbi:Uncharacterised protein [Shigella flexneri]|nr:Uncharacterised protein [Shigella flexneri]
MHFNAEEVLLGAIFSHCHQRRPHAKTNLKRHRRFTAKKRGEIQHIFTELNAHHRPVIFQRMFLAFGQSPLAAHKTTDTAQWAAVFIKFR